MSCWWAAALAMSVCLLPCAAACLRGEAVDRLVALEAAGVIVPLILLLVAEAMRRQPFADLGLALALLSFAGGLAFARFLERWM
jgi:multicomponent Na+:H+ antiporter subunit F